MGIYFVSLWDLQDEMRDENIWATQKAMATLFDVNVPAVSKHLKNIFESGELKVDSVVSKMEITASDGKRYQTQFYSLDAIIAVGYRVNNAGSVSHEDAVLHAETEFEKYRIVQDRLFQSDFDRFLGAF